MHKVCVKNVLKLWIFGVKKILDFVDIFIIQIVLCKNNLSSTTSGLIYSQVFLHELNLLNNGFSTLCTTPTVTTIFNYNIIDNNH